MLRCLLPGRPTADCLFLDVNGDGHSALKVTSQQYQGPLFQLAPTGCARLSMPLIYACGKKASRLQLRFPACQTGAFGPPLPATDACPPAVGFSFQLARFSGKVKLLASPCPVQVWNMNRCSGVLAVFNVQVRETMESKGGRLLPFRPCIPHLLAAAVVHLRCRKLSWTLRCM